MTFDFRILQNRRMNRKQAGFEIRIVSQPGIACRFDEAFRNAVMGSRSAGSGKSTNVQAIRLPASSTWCPSARYSKLA